MEAPGLGDVRRLASLSPQTKARFEALNLGGLPEILQMTSGFREIGRAIGSKRAPVSDRDMKRLMKEAERLLTIGDNQVSNAVATGLLEEIWRSAHESGFDFSRLDPHLGAECRRFLVRWDAFNKVVTPGLSRQR
jgi:hypothetical protein